uniref:Transmembrane protein n=1 Tax=Medicago truncatula TaxID=3880 RepID=I3SVX8_MEDTR|nr:unknown [Medicago truncatula]
MVCAAWICHWPGNCFSSWCLESLTSTCSSLSGAFYLGTCNCDLLDEK